MILKRLWKRYVRNRPDDYQAYISLPTEAQEPTLREIQQIIEDIEFVFEARLDVYARVKRLAIVTDQVPIDGVDSAAFESVLERLEALYADTHSLARIEKWRWSNDRLVKTYVIVPVKPLFPKTDRQERPKSVVG
ncbi:hypothetical protein OB919_12440 [Halobacteria archaeon AArc-curdl1]|uniref:Uncharacterized protein n=1 Tax=Natronosalvus hydrolyticus TaxID=2979988 RepID=A0AAP2Z8Q3_9EURY|nr:hypothetical protein [Halobacteria archaeon AArc-curdl1]